MIKVKTSKTKNSLTILTRVHYPVLKPPNTKNTSQNQKASTCNPRARTATPKKGGWQSGNPKACPTNSSKTLTIVFHTSNHTQSERAQKLRRKEVIQPHLPIRLPCYDFTPIIYPTLGSALIAVKLLTLGVVNSHGVTGGVYKTRERIHGSMLTCHY